MGFLSNVFGAGANSAMGLSLGEAARNAATSTLEEERYNVLAQQYQNQLAQSMMNAKHAAIQGAYAKQSKPFNPNNSPAYTMPMSNLATLWRAKFGDEWVELFEEEFWQDARVRMTRAGMFEEAQGWFRLKEDV